MTAVVAFLRGINVGGRSRVAMRELRRIAGEVGFRDATTHLQSGNLVASVDGDVASVAGRLQEAIAADLGVDVAVIVRTADRLGDVASAHPFAGSVSDPRFLHVVFLDEAPAPEAVAALDPDRSPDDRFQVDGQHVYVAYPGGSGRSKLDLAYFERTLRVVGTARNWNTVTKLAEMAGATPD